MKIKFVIVAAIVVALSGCASSKKSPTQKQAAAKEWNQARANVLTSLAKSQFETGNIDKSQQTAAEALRLDPDNAALHVLCARMNIEKGQLEPAIRELEAAKKLDAKNAEADYLSGVVYQRWQKNQQALDCYTASATKNPNELAYTLACAETLVAMSRSTEALDTLKARLDFFEHNPVLHHAIGQLLVDTKKYTEAVASLQQAAILAPEDMLVREHLATAEFYNHQYTEAAELFARLVNTDAGMKRAELWIALGECQMQTKKATLARASFDRATQADPASCPAWLCLAKASLQCGDVKRAELCVTKAVAIDNTSSEVHLMMGYVRLRQNNMTAAFREFQVASALDQKDPTAMCMVGYVLEHTGKSAEAMRYYAAAMKLKPNDELATHLMASVDMSE